MTLNTSTKLTAKLMEDKLKQGWTTVDFAQHLGISVDIFLSILDKTFDGKAYTFYSRRLKENDKKRAKNINRARNSSTKKFKQKHNLKLTAITEADLVAEPTSNSEVSISHLNSLTSEADDIKNMICDLEKQHSELVSKRKDARTRLTNLKNDMIQLRSVLEKKSTEVESIISDLSEISEKISIINTDQVSAKEILSELQLQINELKKFSIKVSDNSFEMDTEYPIPDIWKDIRNSWLDDVKFKSFTLSELEQLSKSVALRNELIAKGLYPIFTFSSSKLQSSFDGLVAE